MRKSVSSGFVSHHCSNFAGIYNEDWLQKIAYMPKCFWNPESKSNCQFYKKLMIRITNEMVKPGETLVFFGWNLLIHFHAAFIVKIK